MKRYHPVLVFLHWLLVIMILMGLIMGGNVLSETANSDPQKIAYLRIHMLMGMLILILMVVRLIVRIFTCHPPQVDIGNVVFNKLGVAMHYLLYGVIFLMGATGIVTAIITGLPDIIFAGSGALNCHYLGSCLRRHQESGAGITCTHTHRNAGA